MITVPSVWDISHCDCCIAVLIMDVGESRDSDCVDSNAVIEAVLSLLLVQPLSDTSYTKFYREWEEYIMMKSLFTDYCCNLIQIFSITVLRLRCSHLASYKSMFFLFFDCSVRLQHTSFFILFYTLHAHANKWSKSQSFFIIFFSYPINNL